MMDLLAAFRLELNPTSPDIVAFVGGGGKTSTLFRLAQAIADAGHRVVTTTTTHIGPEQLERSPSTLLVTEDNLPFEALSRELDIHNQTLLVGPTVEATRGHKVKGLSPEQVDRLAEQTANLGIDAILMEADGSRRLPVKAPAEYEPALPSSTTLVVPIIGMDAIGKPIDAGHVHRPEHIRSILDINADDDSIRLSPALAARLLSHPQGGAKVRETNAAVLPLLNKAECTERKALSRQIAHQLTQVGFPCLIGALGIGQSDPILERWAPSAAIVLAAGESKRMGRAKQLEVVDGEPMVVRAVRIALQSDATTVYVVTGAYAEAVVDILSPLQAQTDERLRIVHNPDWATGQSSSMRAAIEHLQTEKYVGASLFLPVDQPFLPPLLLRQILRLWRQGADLIAPSVDGNIRGAPALFDRSLWPELTTLSGDRGGRPLLQKYRDKVTTVSTPANVLIDFDSPADLAQV